MGHEEIIPQKILHIPDGNILHIQKIQVYAPFHQAFQVPKMEVLTYISCM